MRREGKKRILVVDDSPTIRNLMSQRLGKMGYLVDSVESGDKAIELLQEDTGDPVHLILLDQIMPGQDGISTFELIKRKFENPPLSIMVTAHGSIHLAVEFMKRGGFGFVLKPVDFDILGLEINRALEKLNLKQQRDEALAANHAAKEAAILVASATRSFHEPLSWIRGYAQALFKTQTRADQDSLTEKIIESTERFSKSVDDVIEAALLGSGCVKMNVHALYPDEIAELIPQEIEKKANSKGLWLRCEIQDQTPAFLANREQLGHILEHLLENAIKFTGEGGVTIKAKDLGERVALSVSDTGIGIDEHHLPTLFDGLWSGGIGGPALCINRMLVELMGGEIQVESKFGQGTKFTIKLRKAFEVK
ncbi:MAG: response regulator [Deltaproteobacteria bacterium]|nr:response regulator [Deltaproteobacteria bacterium]MBW2051512.1 response regulator [Deltaproteobacteria bacterium]MBW2142623.1 response regulator [Deltaproteobacteria bacterium]